MRGNLRRLAATLDAAGTTLDDLTKLTVYSSDLSQLPGFISLWQEAGLVLRRNIMILGFADQAGGDLDLGVYLDAVGAFPLSKRAGFVGLRERFTVP